MLRLIIFCLKNHNMSINSGKCVRILSKCLWFKTMAMVHTCGHDMKLQFSPSQASLLFTRQCLLVQHEQCIFFHHEEQVVLQAFGTDKSNSQLCIPLWGKLCLQSPAGSCGGIHSYTVFFFVYFHPTLKYFGLFVYLFVAVMTGNGDLSLDLLYRGLNP